MSRYLGTFLRHKIALLLPIIIALTVSGWYAHSRPYKYESSMTVWFDTAAPNPSSLENPLNYTPAGQGQQVLQEFLSTGTFLIAVGHRSSLAQFLANDTPTGTGHPASLLGRSSSSSPLLNSEIVATLDNAFVVSVTGPQVVRITMTAGNPAYMPATLNAVADEYTSEVTASLKSRDSASASYYQTQVNAAQLSLNTANAAVLAYQRTHPGELATTDPNFNQLTQVAFQAQSTLTGLQNSLQQVTLALRNVLSPASFHVIDSASSPFRLSNKKHEIFTIVAGLFGGLIISVLALSAFRALDKTARREEDIDGVLGMQVVATIRQLPRQRSLPAAGD